MPFLPPANYAFVLTKTTILKYLPKLSEGDNFEFTSSKTDDYNCVAWVLDSDEEWIQFQDEQGEWDIRLSRYIAYFQSLGFTETINAEPGKDITRIAIYADTTTHEFTHVARQLPDGRWTRKLGEWEDITHDSPELLAGPFYGSPSILMERRVK